MALAQRVGRDPSVSADIEMNQRLPTVGMVVRLAAGLEVSVGWLAYGIGSPHPEETPATTEGMSARIKTARMEQGFTKAGLARLADLSATALANIEKGRRPAWTYSRRWPRRLRCHRLGWHLVLGRSYCQHVVARAQLPNLLMLRSRHC